MYTATAASAPSASGSGLIERIEKNASKATSTSTPANAQRTGARLAACDGRVKGRGCHARARREPRQPTRSPPFRAVGPATRQQPGDQHGRGQRSHEQRGSDDSAPPLWLAVMVSARRGTTISASGRISAKPIR